MRIRTGNTKNGRLFYVIKTYYDAHGKEHTLTVEKLGNEHDIRQKYGRDPDEWAKEHVAMLNELEKKENQPIDVSFFPSKRMASDKTNTFHSGYLFLQALYHELQLDKLCKEITDRHKFEYDLNGILSRLLYGRILSPSSKLSTYEFSNSLLEKPGFEEHQIYRALDVISEESDFIQSAVYQNSFALGKRHTGVIYYDCTNYFFEMEQAEEGHCHSMAKEKKTDHFQLLKWDFLWTVMASPFPFAYIPAIPMSRLH